MTTTMKMALAFLALSIAQMALMPAGYTDDNQSSGIGQPQIQNGETGGEGNGARSTGPSTLPTVGTIPLSGGMALYNQYCAGCHGTSKLGKTAAAIQNAINSNKGGMGSLKSLTPAQISSIATASSTQAPPLTSLPDGTALYNQYCFGCHGTGKLGKSAAAIQNAINSNTGGMGSLKSLTSAQISAIGSAAGTLNPTPVQVYTPTPLPTLGTTPPPPPAAAPAKTWNLYNQYCAGCHGTAKQGASAASIQSAINSVSQMGPLKTLTPAEVSALAAGQ